MDCHPWHRRCSCQVHVHVVVCYDGSVADVVRLGVQDAVDARGDVIAKKTIDDVGSWLGWRGSQR